MGRRLGSNCPNEIGDSALALCPSFPPLKVLSASLWIDRLMPECLCYQELVIKDLCIA